MRSIVKLVMINKKLENKHNSSNRKLKKRADKNQWKSSLWIFIEVYSKFN